MTPELKSVLAISPMRETVIMRPQNLLQVVIVDHRQVRWQNAYGRDANRIQLKCIRTEDVQCDGFPRKRRGNFQIQFHSKRMHTWQTHFWFRLNPYDLGKLGELRGDVEYDLAQLTFRRDEGLVGELKVVLKITDKDREEYFDFLTQTSFRNLDPVGRDAEYTGVGGRWLSEKDSYIFNANPKEKFILLPNQRDVLIEMPQPCRRGPFRGAWKAMVESNSRHNLAVQQLPPRFISTQSHSSLSIQRFLVQNLTNKLNVGMTKLNAGRVLLTVEDENKTRHVTYDRCVHFYVQNSRDEAYFGDSGDEDDGECRRVRQQDNGGWSAHENALTYGSRFHQAEDVEDLDIYEDNKSFDDHFNTEFQQVNHYRFEEWRRPKRSKVEITELNCGGDLEVGTTTLRLTELKRKRLTVDDVVDGQVINLPDGYDLVIVMDRSEDQTWGMELGGKFLKMDYQLPDGKRHRWVFSRKPRYDQKSDTDVIKFKWGRKKREVRVIKVRENDDFWHSE